MILTYYVQWKSELDEIIEIALEDSDQWVSMVAELLKKYPLDGTINFDIEQNSAVFTDLVGELKKIGKDTFSRLIFNNPFVTYQQCLTSSPCTSS